MKERSSLYKEAREAYNSGDAVTALRLMETAAA
jgi:hypothetical protein